MKKIPVKTILLICILAVNIITLLVFSNVLKQNTNQKKYTFVSSEINVDETKKYYEVKKGDLKDKEKISSNILYGENQYTEYVIDTELNYSIFDEIDINDVLGKYDDSEIKPKYKGRIVSVTNTEGKNVIKVFNYDFLLVTSTFNYSSFYSHNFNQDQFFLEIGNKEYSLHFKNVLYDTSSVNSINVAFEIENNDLFLPEGYETKVNYVKETYNDIFFIENIDDFEINTEKSFSYIDNDEVKTLRVFCERVVDDCYIISALGLKEGMKIYE